jgi:soluble lytic murein transglycosylase-like protein
MSYVLQFFILIVIACKLQSVCAVDLEVNTSLRCVNLFRYYEAKYDIPDNLLHSIAIKETGKVHSNRQITLVWPWTATVEGKPYYFDNKDAAVNFVRKQLSIGKRNIDVNCMQINLGYHPYAFVNLDDAFNPELNIDYAASFLRSKYDKLKNWNKAVAHYHSATDHLGNKYLADVKKISNNIHHHKAALKKVMNKSSKKYYRFSDLTIHNNSNADMPSKKNVQQNKQTRPKRQAQSRRSSEMMVYVPNR